jgi:transcriptional regulator with XRE-family HTH domain
MSSDSPQISGQHPSKEVSEQRAPRAIDIYVGNQIQLGRALAGISQAALGQSVGLTRRQIQDFELGLTRVSAAWLFELAGALDVPVRFFFSDTPVVSNVVFH